MTDVSGKGVKGAIKMSKVLTQRDAGGDNLITWTEFQAAVAAVFFDSSI